MIYKGSCHCEQIAFEVEGELTRRGPSTLRASSARRSRAALDARYQHIDGG